MYNDVRNSITNSKEPKSEAWKNILLYLNNGILPQNGNEQLLHTNNG